MGLGLLDLRAEQFDATKVEFRSRRRPWRKPSSHARPARDGPRRDLIEAYLQLGRAYSFAHDYATAEVWFRKMHDLAGSWVSADPSQAQAHDLLASSYRKLADLKKFSREFVEARRLYSRAIEIGEVLLARSNDSFEFRTHLAIALDDLAQVAKNRTDSRRRGSSSGKPSRTSSSWSAPIPSTWTPDWPCCIPSTIARCWTEANRGSTRPLRDSVASAINSPSSSVRAGSRTGTVSS